MRSTVTCAVSASKTYEPLKSFNLLTSKIHPNISFITNLSSNFNYSFSPPNPLHSTFLKSTSLTSATFNFHPLYSSPPIPLPTFPFSKLSKSFQVKSNLSRSFFGNSSSENQVKSYSSNSNPLTSNSAVNFSVRMDNQVASNAERLSTINELLEELFLQSLKKTFPDLEEIKPLIESCNNPKFGDYQCNNAMGIWSRIKTQKTDFKNPNAIGQAIMKNLPESPLVEKLSIAGPGFVNVVVSKKWMEDRIENVLLEGLTSWAPKIDVKRAVVDFSSPNIAKEMHVGHLRSTIIGDTLANMLEYCHVEVLRRNHVGDWGTQFGMLIEFLFEKFPNWEEIGEQAIGDLQSFYKAAKLKFDEDEKFKEKAQLAVVKLQGGDANYRAAWKKICDISRKEFDAVYQRLNVKLEEKGESFYNPFIPNTVQILEEKKLVSMSEGAKCIFLENFKIPLILVKSDGGFNYATTDMTALWYRLNVEKSEWIVYVTDVGQSQHFDMFFNAARKAGWLPENKSLEIPRVSHVGFGLVLGTDGKRFRTRSSEVVRLVDLLDEAMNRSKQGLVERGREGEWSEEEMNSAACALGYGAVKYADLKNNRNTNYTFDFDQMLDMRGNTAVYLLYAHARICSIIRKSEKNMDELKLKKGINLNHPSERALAIDIIKFPEIVKSSIRDLLPNTLCEYLYNLSTSFTTFYTNCQVVGSEEEASRLLMCEATAMVMRQCFYLLGITPLYRL